MSDERTAGRPAEPPDETPAEPPGEPPAEGPGEPPAGGPAEASAETHVGLRVLEDARRALEAGRPWRARDLLAAHVESERDPDALALLGQVLNDMGDLPRAGAVWFAVGAKGPEADAAVAAWREQAGDDFGVMWRSLPASVRAEPRPRRIQALRDRALAAGADASDASEEAGRAASDRSGATEGPEDDSGFDAAWLVAWVLAIAFVVFAVIGFVTALGWIVPG